ncbi:hypothetical protein [Streptomyces sp. NBC_01264]|uniref:hypothetical protein n=1 Tax=Streptomyces sp. NBC_01264 TaxID=2903804 RepID=UPI00224D7562|nr:hypothetical protein [Streptomyces sp. NBC_01264]MCX4781809.1 hypothetical protein [Streptomyces sp. NBC_01264]
MSDRSCDACGVPFRGKAGYLAAGALWRRGHWLPRRLLLCEECFEAGRGRDNPDPGGLPVTWRALAGRGTRLPPSPCAECRQPVIRNDDPLLLRTLCSHACATAHHRRPAAAGAVGEEVSSAARTPLLPPVMERVQIAVRLERRLLATARIAASSRGQGLSRYLEALIAADAHRTASGPARQADPEDG